MSMPILRKWLHLPSRIALLLGVGALSGTGAIPAMAEPGLHNGPVRAPQQSAKSFGEVRIWSEDGRIYFSEGGNEPRELQLSDTPEARRLIHGHDPVLEIRLHLVLVSGVGVDHVPAEHGVTSAAPSGRAA